MNPPQPARHPEPVTLEGRYCRLKPLAVEHAADLFAATCAPSGPDLYAWLPEQTPANLAGLTDWIEHTAARGDWLTFAVIDLATGKCGGRQSLMRIRPEHASIEVGAVVWGREVARTRVATEALYLLGAHIFNDLGFLRFEWKCNDQNLASVRAAKRFGYTYEGTFRADMIVKGQRRDTAWFSILASEWPAIQMRLERWLAPQNFDAGGQQLQSLSRL